MNEPPRVHQVKASLNLGVPDGWQQSRKEEKRVRS